METRTNLILSCPYCRSEESVPHPGDYKPRYRNCAACGKRFIYEPVRGGVDCLRPEEADCCSDPECRATEMGASGQE